MKCKNHQTLLMNHCEDHLGQVQSHRQPGVRGDQERPKGLISGQTCDTKVVQHVKLYWFKVFPNIQDLWAKSRGKILQGISQEQVPPRDGLLAKYVEMKAVENNKKGLFKTVLKFHDNLKQAWVTFKLFETLQMLAKRAARSTASVLLFK